LPVEAVLAVEELNPLPEEQAAVRAASPTATAAMAILDLMMSSSLGRVRSFG
jgi:hypothetical protein